MASPKIDFTSRDFDSIKLALRAHLQAKFPDTWKDFYESAMGMSWLELVAYCFDILSFYLDVQANESYLSTSRDRLSVVNICKLIGYKLRPATSAAVVTTASLTAVQASDVIISVGTSVTAASGSIFRALTEQRILAGALGASITFAEGEAHSDTFISDGTVFQKFKLTDPEVIADSISTVVAGAAWSEVDSLVFGTDSSEVFAVSYDEDDYGYVEFGDNTNGLVPPIGSAITVTYRVGGGLQGNIRLSEIDEDVTGLTDTAPPGSVPVHITNDTQRGSGGEERETIEHAKYWAPRWVSTNGRAVTEYDFDTLATLFNDPTYGAFAYTKAKLRQEIPELNTVDIYTWARDAGGDIVAPSAGLKQALEDYFMNNGEGAVRVICTDVEVQDGYRVYLDISVLVTVSDLYAATEVAGDVSDALVAMFSSSEIRPGAAFRLSLAYNAIQDVAGVEHALINMITASYQTAETMTTGDGVTTNFAFALDLESGLPVVPHTVQISASGQVAEDDGDGDLLISEVSVGTIDYDTGVIDITFPSAPADGASVNATYRHILDYQRGEAEFTTDGSERIRGALSFPPVVPYDGLIGEKGIAFTDGYQTVIDDGEGHMTGDINSAGNNVFDYDTGAYDFQFATTPPSGRIIYSTYRQRLQTPSEDIPLEKTQLAVRGLITIATQSVET